jgi:hypothetical protein
MTDHPAGFVKFYGNHHAFRMPSARLNRLTHRVSAIIALESESEVVRRLGL